MRILKFFAVVAMIFAGGLARFYGRQCARQVRGAHDCSPQEYDAYGAFEFSARDGGNSCRRAAQKYQSPPPVEPSEVQANPFLK